MGRRRLYPDKKAGYLAQQERRKTARTTRLTEFIGVDGEGSGDGADHRYVLLSVGSDSISDEHGLTFRQIMPFLWSQFERNQNAAYCGFFLGYDFAQWIKDIGADEAGELFSDRGRKGRDRKGGSHTQTFAPTPVRYENWEFDFLGLKRFKLRPRDSPKGTPWMYICDAGSFYQASFMSVIDPAAWNNPIVTEEEYATLDEGKKRRSTARLDSDMLRYNCLENAVLARLMGRLDQGFTQAGIKLARNQWYGPGQAAQSWLDKQPAIPHLTRKWELPDNKPGMPKPRRMRKISVPDPSLDPAILEVARKAYYGGWFEIFAHGHVPGQSWEYDINSAYPYAISELPCLLHGRWKHRRDRGRGGEYVLVRAIAEGHNRVCGAGLHRTPDGRILRPQRTSGYYWYNELDAAFRCGAVSRVDVLESWSYEPCDCLPPLRGVQGLYEARLRAGKNTSAGKSYKLIYNSMYGKFAQSIGFPKYANSIWASAITSACRTMILDAIASHPRGVQDLLMVATDGVYFASQHESLLLSDKLGEWTETAHDNLTLFKPGVYWDDRARQEIRDGKAPHFKSRGISAAAFARSIEDIDTQFGNWGHGTVLESDWPLVSFAAGFSMISPLQALQRNNWGLCGQVSTASMKQSSNPVDKRQLTCYDAESGLYRSQPYQETDPLESTEYSKKFGIMDDPDEYGYNEDGYILDQWKGMLR
jgi:hypothetical protein